MAFGQDEDEDEKFRQMLGGIIGDGPAPYDMQTGMEQQSLAPPVMPQGAPGGLGGYTPPPAAAAPQYLDHVEGHQFGGGDIAMLGGMLAALLAGGKHRGEIAGSLAGQYGGAVMQANGRADQRNQQVDQYNSQLASKDTGLERWKADQQAQQYAGNLKTRGDELKLQQTREQRIADAQAAEDARDPVSEAERVAKARAGVELDTTRQKNDMEVGTKEMLAQLLGVNGKGGKYGAPVGTDGKPAESPEKVLKHKQAQAILDGIAAGTHDPTTGKPIVKLDEDGNPIKPPTPASAAAAKKLNDALAPFEGTEVGDESVWKPIASNPTIREKSRRDDAALSSALPALDAMIKLRKDNGTNTGFGKEGGEVSASYDVERGKVESALGVLKNIGVISPTEAENLAKTIPTLGPGMSDLSRMLPESMGGGDSTLGKLQGSRKEWEKLVERGRSKYGLRAKSAASEQPMGESPSGIKFSVDPQAEAKFNGGGFGPGDSTGKPDSGQRTVTVTYTDGETESFTGSDSDIQKLRGKSAVRSVE